MRFFNLALGFFTAVMIALPAAAEKVTFKSRDGLDVTAELSGSQSSTLIVLFHQAGSSRGEYKTIAPRLNALGYRTLAVDQRSGKSFSGIANETAKRAAKKGKAQSYKAARPDMEAAIAFARNVTGAKKVVIWGSSYSAALSLIIAGQKTEKVNGVLSFSPGEFIRGVSVRKSASNISVPTFITSARAETGQWKNIHKAIPTSVKAVAFKPEGKGRHGSSALIKSRSPNFEEYWVAVETFLKKNF